MANLEYNNRDKLCNKSMESWQGTGKCVYKKPCPIHNKPKAERRSNLMWCSKHQRVHKEGNVHNSCRLPNMPKPGLKGQQLCPSVLTPSCIICVYSHSCATYGSAGGQSCPLFKESKPPSMPVHHLHKTQKDIDEHDTMSMVLLAEHLGVDLYIAMEVARWAVSRPKPNEGASGFERGASCVKCPDPLPTTKEQGQPSIEYLKAYEEGFNDGRNMVVSDL